MWLTNNTDRDEELGARELFGFNIGTFSELTAGRPKCLEPQMFGTTNVCYTCLETQNVANRSLLLLGDAGTVTDQIPWLITSDLQPVVLLSTGGNGQVQKELMTVADVFCWITRVRGQTEATMLDHDLEPLCKDQGQNTNYEISTQFVTFVFIVFLQTGKFPKPI